MRTHCKNGHELTEKNSYKRTGGCVECRECARVRDKARYPLRKQEVIARVTQWAKDNPEKFKANQAKQELRLDVKQRRKKFYEETKSAIWRKFSILKSTAEKYHRDFTLSQEDYENLVRDNICFYCSGSLPEVGYGIDRQDNRLGYTKENSIACCEHCNERKGRLEGLGFTYPRTIELLKELLGK